MPTTVQRERDAARAESAAAPPEYQSGFANEFATEALPGALPVGQNSPQRCPYGLYAEQISGTAFTAPRHANRRTWFYRIRPGALHKPFKRIDNGLLTSDFSSGVATPNQLRWDPLPIPTKPTDFIDGLVTMAGNGGPDAQGGCGIHIYAANRSMTDRFFSNADGELLIVPQQGRLAPRDRDGRPRGRAPGDRRRPARRALPRRAARWCRRAATSARTYGAPFRCPTSARSARTVSPTRATSGRPSPGTRTARATSSSSTSSWATSGRPSSTTRRSTSSPGTATTRRTSTTSAASTRSARSSYDHPDPSIFLVLQSPSDTPGVDMIDFVIFPPRWLVMEHTFRPPWFHRNVASEFMGLIHGVYDAKAEGFVPGGASLHNCMTGHGPDADTFAKASTARRLEARPDRRHDGVHVRDAPRDPADEARTRSLPAAARLLHLLAGAHEALRSGTAVSRADEHAQRDA